MTYRLDSTFPSSPLPSTFFADSLRPPSVSWSERNHVPIAWVNGDCTAPNGRHHYVRELMRWIHVDVYGGCLANKAWPPGKPTQIFPLKNPHLAHLTPTLLPQTRPWNTSSRPINFTSLSSPQIVPITSIHIPFSPRHSAPVLFLLLTAHAITPPSPHTPTPSSTSTIFLPRAPLPYDLLSSQRTRGSTPHISGTRRERARPWRGSLRYSGTRPARTMGRTGDGDMTRRARCASCAGRRSRERKKTRRQRGKQ